MHNLHLLVVEAESGSDACSTVEGAIQNFGDENNWRVICGATRSDGKEVFQSNSGRWAAESVEDLQSQVKEAVFGEGHYLKGFKEALDKLASGQKMDWMEWFQIEKHGAFKGAQAWAIMPLGGRPELTRDTFDLFKVEFRGWKLDEFGVTHLGDLDAVAPENLWVVIVDMHS